MREIEKSADVNDTASDIEMLSAETSIALARSKVRQDQAPDAQGNYETLDCVECDLEIGLERLKVAPRNLMCVYCAAKKERKW